jgi:pyrimidine operon attenuation protein/uracil phosphoribosyltransferase
VLSAFLSAPSQAAIPVLDAAAIARTLDRMAREILEHHPDPKQLALIGIPSRGVEIATRLGQFIRAATGTAPFCGAIDISMHRDDIGARGSIFAVQPSRLPEHLERGAVILVDDVLQSGRTCRAALDALSSFGRPGRIEYAVLIDRGLRELPIAADYVGKNVEAGVGERVFVRLPPLDELEGVWLERVPSSRRKAKDVLA